MKRGMMCEVGVLKVDTLCFLFDRKSEDILCALLCEMILKFMKVMNDHRSYIFLNSLKVMSYR